MIASEKSFEPHSRDALPNSQKVYVPGTLHPDIRVPMREITLSPTKHMSGELEENEPVRVYDCSGPWGDPEFSGSVEQGLPPLRDQWILGRGDVEEYDGRDVKPQDNGYLTASHAQQASERRGGLSPLNAPANAHRRPLRASAGHPVTQLWYARQGIITPEMEFIAIRENLESRPRISADLSERHRARRPPQTARRLRAAVSLWTSTFDFRRSTRRLHAQRLPPLPATHPRRRSPPNSSAPKSPPAAPSFPRTSIIPSSSR